MHVFDSALSLHAKDFKAALWQSVQDNKITQTDIAGALNIDQATISRWMNVAWDLHFPAFAIPSLSSDRVKALQSDLLRYLVSHSGYRMGTPVHIIGSVNGSADDEALELAAELGRIAEKIAAGHVDIKSARRVSIKMRETLDRLDAELDSMEKNRVG